MPNPSTGQPTPYEHAPDAVLENTITSAPQRNLFQRIGDTAARAFNLEQFNRQRLANSMNPTDANSVRTINIPPEMQTMRTVSNPTPGEELYRTPPVPLNVWTKSEELSAPKNPGKTLNRAQQIGLEVQNNNPFGQGYSSDRLKEKVVNSYAWGPKIPGLIKEMTMLDLSPKISEDSKTATGVQWIGNTGYGGEQRNKEKLITNVGMGTSPQITAHEVLHNLFATQKLAVSKNWKQFNNTWDEFLNRYKTNPDSMSDNDIKVAVKMMETDKNLSESKLYRGNDAYDNTNERFAYLGDMLGHKKWMGDIPKELSPYYKDIFQQTTPAPYASRAEYLKAKGEPGAPPEIPTKNLMKPMRTETKEFLPARRL